MAVIQISRIQIRRGRENQGSGLPQLASGEFGWAIDTQKLFIGNGAVSEGAPFVGNTQILTEHDNLFEYASTYTYRVDTGYLQTGPTVGSPIQRTLQERLDDRVSIRAFGATGDATDQTNALQRAIFQLYLNSANKTSFNSRAILYVEPGNYVITSTIFVPPYVTIQGAGPEKTLFTKTGPGPLFRTINGSSTPEAIADDSITTESNQARYISMSGFSINMLEPNSAAFRLENCTRSEFKDIAIDSLWRSGDDDSNINYAAFQMNSLSSAVTCSLNTFENITVNGFAIGVYSKNDIVNNVWKSCNFRNTSWAYYFGVDTILGNSGQLTGPSNNLITECTFDDVDKTAIWIANGTNNSSNNNKFYNVGNEGASSINPVHPIIVFGNHGNASTGDWFQRTAELSYSQEFINNIPFVPEISGPAITQNDFTQYVRLTQLGIPSKVIRLPADTAKGFEIDYLYKSNQVQATRKGTIHLSVDPAGDLVSLSDDFDFVGDFNFSENLTFTAQNYDENGDNSIDTVALMVLNSTSSDNADFYFRVKTKS